VAGAQKQAEAPAAATAMAGAAGGASGASSGLGAVDKVPSAVDDPRAAVQRTGGSADKSAAAAKGSMHGALGEQTAPEVNEVAAGGPGQDAPGEPLASDAGITAEGGGSKRPMQCARHGSATAVRRHGRPRLRCATLGAQIGPCPKTNTGASSGRIADTAIGR
jgi:hypothetical protein